MGIRLSHIVAVLFMFMGTSIVFAHNNPKRSVISSLDYIRYTDEQHDHTSDNSELPFKSEKGNLFGKETPHTQYFSEQYPDEAKYNGFEYWFDNDYASKTIVTSTDTEIVMSLDIRNQMTGLHTFNIRTTNDQGIYGPLSQSMFYITRPSSEEVGITEYEYWIDNPINTVKVASSSSIVTLSLSMDDLDLGIHQFYFRSKGTNGIWGNLYHTMFVRSNQAEIDGSPIVAYQYSLGENITKVDITPTTSYQLNNYKIDIPDLKDVGSLTKGCTYTFNNTEVILSRKQNVTFNIQFQNEIGNWSNPTCYDFEKSDEVTHEYVKLSTNQKAILDKARKGDFRAFECVVDHDQNYYLKSSAECFIDIYHSNGTLMTSITPDNLHKAYCVGLSSGKYYGIVYNMQDSITLRLLTNEDYVEDPVISYSNETLSITCSQQNAHIYYTIDGTEPNETSIEYVEPVVIRRNCTIKAIATYPGMSPSDVVSYTIDGFKVKAPSIDFIDSKFVLSTGTEEATIYYTINGENPSNASLQYTEPFFIDYTCSIKAIALKEGWYDSDITSYNFDADEARCSTPLITKVDNTLVMTSSTDGAKIHYTTDGSEPTSLSAVYSSPIEIQHNMVLKAIAMKENRLNSAMATYTVDWYKVDTPQFTFDNDKLTISVATPNASIHYTLDGTTPTEYSEKYVSPIELDNNSIVKAIGILENYHPSDVATYTVNSFTCSPASMDYNGRYLTLMTTTNNAEIYYTIDGSTPNTKSTKYANAFDVMGLTTIRTIVVRENYNDSEISEYTTTSYYDGDIVTTSVPGNISKAFEWCGTENITTLTVKGNIDDSDIAYISGMPSIRHIHLDDADISNNTITANAFANSSIVSISLPKTITSVGNDLFMGCNNIAAIVWNANMTLPSSALNGINNPNLLLYVKLKSYSPSSIRNVVANGTADNIVLYDGNGNYNFYCPQEFIARSIAYSHNYTQETRIGECTGWETIALPFDVQSISHSKNGEIAPFAANIDTTKPFWLYSLGDLGFETASEIKANTPYIISMPNNLEYADEYNLSGDVTFKAENVIIPVTSQNVATKGDFIFIPTTLNVTQNDNIYVINKCVDYENQQPGSMFVGNLRNASPFEAYLTLSSHTSKPTMVSLLDLGLENATTSFKIPVKQDHLIVWSANGSIYIKADKDKTVHFYTMNGVLVRIVDLCDGINIISGLPSGTYIVEHNKIIVK